MDTNQLQADKQHLQRQIAILEADYEGVSKALSLAQAEIESLKAELKQAKESLRRAKDSNPVARPSLRRVMKLAAEACMDVYRLGKRWVLKLGNLTRSFRSLTEIWELLVADNWYLSDIFPQHQPQKPKSCVKPRLPFRQPVLAPAFAAIGGAVVSEDIPFY